MEITVVFGTDSTEVDQFTTWLRSLEPRTRSFEVSPDSIESLYPSMVASYAAGCPVVVTVSESASRIVLAGSEIYGDLNKYEPRTREMMQLIVKHLLKRGHTVNIMMAIRFSDQFTW